MRTASRPRCCKGASSRCWSRPGPKGADFDTTFVPSLRRGRLPRFARVAACYARTPGATLGTDHKYWLRKQTVEPVFSVLKRAMGFTHFRLRGFAGVEIEWQLVTLAYNCRGIHRLKPRPERRDRKRLPNPRPQHPRTADRTRTTKNVRTRPTEKERG